MRVLGSINWDLVVSAPRRPGPGETLMGHSLSGSPGGKGANQAVAAARLGADVSMYGSIGKDDHGRDILSGFDAEGVDVSNVSVIAEATGTAVLTLTDDGENSIIVIAGANRATGTDAVERLRRQVQVEDVVVLQLEVAAGTVRQAASVASAAGATVILNAAPYQDVSDILRAIDILVVNETETAELWGAPVDMLEEAHRAASEVAGRNDLTCIVTVGSRGAVVATSTGEPWHADAADIKPVDTTGAGDTFVGALAAFWAEGIGIEDCVRLAVDAGTRTCLGRGAQASMPYRRC